MFEIPPPTYTAERILRTLLNPNIDSKKVCQERPTQVTQSSTYVIDITKLSHVDGMRNDSFGRWEHSGSHILPFHTHVREDGFTETEKCAPGATGSDVFYLRRLHGVHLVTVVLHPLLVHLVPASVACY